MKRIESRKGYAAFIIVITLSLAFIGCDGGGGGGGGGVCADPTVNATGTWQITETNTNNNCGEGVQAPYTLEVTQTGSSVSVYAPNIDRTFSGQICGNTLTWSGSYPEDGGTTTIDSMTATISGNSLSSSSNWRWSDGDDSCSGTTSSTGTRTSSGSGGVSCATVGPGSNPNSGSGTPSDPYMISLGISYGGCSPAKADPGPFYAIIVTGGAYTITQTNGVTDLELYVYQESGLIGTIDNEWGGFDESDSRYLDAGTYFIEVYNNGAANGEGTQDGPFTLTVTGP